MIDMTGPAQGGVIVALVADLYKLLVEKGVLTQGDAIARVEKLSHEIMIAGGETRGLAVALIDIVRDTLANDLDRKPS